MFNKTRQFDPEKDLKLVRKHYVKDGKVVKTEDTLRCRRYFSDGDSYWTNVNVDDSVIEIRTKSDHEIYGVPENA